MCAANFKERFRIVLPLLLCMLFSGCQKEIWNPLAPEHTELLVDGEYAPFNVPRTTMEKLMELVEAADAEYIYAVFSPSVRENTADLGEQIREFIRFIQEDVTGWDFSSGVGNLERQGGVTTSTRASFYRFDTDSGAYRCDLGEVIKDTAHPDRVGFSDILVYPDELSWEYAPKKPSGLYFVYRVEDAPRDIAADTAFMETLMQFAKAEDADGISEMFSITAKRHSKELPQKLPELMDFLRGRVTDWEPYIWAQNVDEFDRYLSTVREMFFYLHTDQGLYRCDVREVLESEYPVDTGVFSISIFPALYPGEDPEYEDTDYKEACTWGRENMGVLVVP